VHERGQNIGKLTHVSEIPPIWSRQDAFGERRSVLFQLSGSIAALTFSVPHGTGIHVAIWRTSMAQCNARVMLIAAFIDPGF